MIPAPPGSFNLHLRLMACLPLLTVAPDTTADDIRSGRIEFGNGTGSTVIEDGIRGYETVDYLLDARAGQHMTVSLATRHGATCFNIPGPGENAAPCSMVRSATTVTRACSRPVASTGCASTCCARPPGATKRRSTAWRWPSMPPAANCHGGMLA